MEYTLWNVILLNIPLVLAEYVCCMILTRGLTKCRPQGKAAVLMLLPYSLLLILGVLNYALQSDAQKKQLGQQQVSLEQQKLYIRNLESVQQDVRIFHHDFKNRMAGIRLRADEGDLKAVQEFLAEVTGDFEKKVGEKIFQASQMGNIQIMELKGLLVFVNGETCLFSRKAKKELLELLGD